FGAGDGEVPAAVDARTFLWAHAEDLLPEHRLEAARLALGLAPLRKLVFAMRTLLQAPLTEGERYDLYELSDKTGQRVVEALYDALAEPGRAEVRAARVA